MRKKVSEALAAQVMFASDMKCCVCQSTGEQIHHLDANPENNSFENLVFLCFQDHNKASIKGGLARKLSKELILLYRKKHYETIEHNRALSQKVISHTISKLTTENILQAALDATIILDLSKMKLDFFDANWEAREEMLYRLKAYSDHTSVRSTYEILLFLSQVASMIRSRATESTALSIYALTIAYFPQFNFKAQKRHDIELGSVCINIGYYMAYDAAIKLKNLLIMRYGLIIWKSIYKHAVETKNTKLKEKIIEAYNNLESTLKRPERDDLGNAQELVKIFREDLKTPELSFPLYPDYLM